MRLPHAAVSVALVATLLVPAGAADAGTTSTPGRYAAAAKAPARQVQHVQWDSGAELRTGSLKGTTVADAGSPPPPPPATACSRAPATSRPPGSRRG